MTSPDFGPGKLKFSQGNFALVVDPQEVNKKSGKVEDFPEKTSVFPAPKSGLVIIKITRRPCGNNSNTANSLFNIFQTKIYLEHKKSQTYHIW
jgi:hypothetical protein